MILEFILKAILSIVVIALIGGSLEWLEPTDKQKDKLTIAMAITGCFASAWTIVSFLFYVLQLMVG